MPAVTKFKEGEDPNETTATNFIIFEAMAPIFCQTNSFKTHYEDQYKKIAELQLDPSSIFRNYLPSEQVTLTCPPGASKKNVHKVIHRYCTCTAVTKIYTNIVSSDTPEFTKLYKEAKDRVSQIKSRHIINGNLETFLEEVSHPDFVLFPRNKPNVSHSYRFKPY